MKMTPLSSVFRSVNGISLSINFRLLIVTVVVGIGAAMVRVPVTATFFLYSPPFIDFLKDTYSI